MLNNVGEEKKLSKKGTWKQALTTFFFPILLVLILRWLFIEPFVIPSGSMIPNLLIHDHILVNKLSYGVRTPFFDNWIFQWSQPQRGDIVVFKYPHNPQIYYIKRLIGLPGDEILVKSHDIIINGTPVKYTPVEISSKVIEDLATDLDGSFDYFNEQIGLKTYTVRYFKRKNADAKSEGYGDQKSIDINEEAKFLVPKNEYFFMGDNRDQSSDGRVWGFVPNKYIVGRASLVWLSCENMLESANFACDPASIRFKRVFKQLY